MPLAILVPDPEALVDTLLLLEAARLNPEHVPTALHQAYQTLATLTTAVTQVQDERALNDRWPSYPLTARRAQVQAGAGRDRLAEEGAAA